MKKERSDNNNSVRLIVSVRIMLYLICESYDMIRKHNNSTRVFSFQFVVTVEIQKNIVNMALASFVISFTFFYIVVISSWCIFVCCLAIMQCSRLLSLFCSGVIQINELNTTRTCYSLNTKLSVRRISHNLLWMNEPRAYYMQKCVL